MTQEIFQPSASAPYSPYFDDWDPSKNYVATLWKPALALQARELTQAMTQLQAQIAYAASLWYKSGTPVQGARITVTTQQPYMQISAYDGDGQPIDPLLLVGITFTGQTSGQQIHISSCDEDNRYLFFSYLGGELEDGEMFQSVTTPTRTFYMVAGSVGRAVTAYCSDGVIFIDGYYIKVDETNLVVAVDNPESTYSIGFSVLQDIVTSTQDSTLNDNAQGSYNYNAPGADRYRIRAELYSFEGTTAPENIRFVSGVVISNEIIIKEQEDPLYDSTLIDLLAKRTYDESGSYTVNPWKIQLYDVEGNYDQYQVSIQEGSGYIRGYEVSTITSTNIMADKPRSTISKSTTSTFNDLGLYTLGLYTNGVIDALNLPAQETNVNVMTGQNGTGTVLGTCTIQNYVREGSEFRIYLMNASTVLSTFNGAMSLVDINDSSSYINIYINEYGFAELYGSEQPFIYDTGLDMVATLANGTTRYQLVKRYTGTSDSSGGYVTFLDTDGYISFPTTDGLVALSSPDGMVDLNTITMTPNNTDTTSSATITGSGITGSTQYTAWIRVTSEGLPARVKTLTSRTEEVTVANGTDIVTLENSDILDIVSVVQSSNTNTDTPDDISSYLTLDNGQTDYYYNNGSISGFNSSTINAFKSNSSTGGSTSYSITYRYFIHSGSGPFTVDSYNTIPNQATYSESGLIYDAIPTYTASTGTTYSLRDCFDYRVKSTDTIQYVPVPRTELVATVDIYLPRTDAVYVTSSGEFGILQGIASEDPVEPVGNDYMMILYYLENRAYVTTVKDVTLSYVNNQRYTMKDIGRLNTRINNLEDTLSLSLLELSATTMQITDTDGLDRYKTGIFTDNFSSFDNSDYTNSEWDCNIDAIEQSIRANYNAENCMFNLYENRCTNIQVSKNGKIVTLPYTTSTTYAENTYVTDTVNVQNLLFYSWFGNLTLTPSLDTWVNDLGQFIVSETYTETAKPSTTYRTWSTTAYYTNHNWSQDWGFGYGVGKAVTTTYTQTTSYVGSWTISDVYTTYETQDEYMRVRDVEYEVTGMRPGVQLTATLDDVPVTLSADTPDSDGYLSGYFTVPEGIPCGTKLFYMTDADGTSTAETYYTAKGTTTWVEIDRTYIREWTAVTTTTSTESAVAWDPIAESVYIEDSTGIYVDSVDIFFASKDSTNVEVWCYIVECENGYPTTRILPFSMVSLSPDEVNVSDTGTVATNFKFGAPIYLEGGQEYAIVVATTSYEYSMFISTLGNSDLNSGVGVHEQPYLGNMFMSQNTRTWVAETQSDISFRLYQCIFDTTVSGTAMFYVNPLDEDFEVAMATMVSNVFAPDMTSATLSYRWSTESTYTQFDNYSDVFFSTLKTIAANSVIGTTVSPSLELRIVMETQNPLLTPEIDLEDTYGIFTNNICTTNTDDDASLYPYIAGTYISKSTTLKYASDDIRVILDAICPNESKVDVYVKANIYNPSYVEQSIDGTVGVATESGEALKGEVCQVYYWNSVTEQLEPQSEVQIAGYADRKLYFSTIGNPDEFYDCVEGAVNDGQYTGLHSQYRDILVIPVLSSSNIPCTDWNSEATYSTGEYVFYNGYLWVAIRDVAANQIPSEMGISWQVVHCVKTISTVQTDETVEWRPMTCGDVSESTVERGEQFVEYTYTPELEFESEFQTFSIKIVMKSKDKVNIPRVKNLRAIATL